VEELEEQIERLYERGKYAEAIPLAEEILAIRQRHQSGWTNAKGEPSERYEIGDARRAVDVLRLLAALTSEQPADLATAAQLVSQESELCQQGKYAQAAQLRTNILDIHRRVLGDDHPDTLISIGNMASRLASQGKLAEAEPYLREALEGSRRVLGDDHRSTLTWINNMGHLLESQDKLAEAEPYYREALERRAPTLSSFDGWQTSRHYRNEPAPGGSEAAWGTGQRLFP